MTATGEGGSIEGIGSLSSLYSKVNIRVISYQRLGASVEVGPAEKDHSVLGDDYDNPWLKIRVRQLNGAKFADIDTHWPNSAIVAVRQRGTTASVLYGRALQDSARPLDATLRETFESDSPLTYFRCGSVPAVRSRRGTQKKSWRWPAMPIGL